MKYPAYPAYGKRHQRSQLTFPSHWEVQRLRFVVLFNPVRSEVADWDGDTPVSFVPMDAVGEFGGMDASQERPIADVYNGYTYFAEQDIVVAKITPCFENGKGAIARGLKNGVGFGTTEFHVLRPLPGVSAQWLFYFTMSDAFRQIGGAEMLGAGGQKRVPEDFIKNLRTGIPPLNEQEHIAAFLDWKTAQIDALIAKKQDLIEKLKEKRLTVITKAVTKGLDPSVPMTSQPDRWFGKHPDKWGVMSLRFAWEVLDCKHRTVSFVLEGIPLASIREVHDFEVDLSSANHTTVDEYLDLVEGGRAPQVGDIIYSRNVSVGEAAVVATTESFALGQDVCLLRSAQNHPRYMNYLLASKPLREQTEAMMVGSTFRRINVGQIKALRILVPPEKEQREIATYLDSMVKNIDTMIQKTEEAAHNLTEYRTTLITAAVTGQIDVRHITIPTPA